MNTVRYMLKHHYHQKTINRFVAEIDSAFEQIAADPTGFKSDFRGYNPRMLCIGPLEPFGHRIYYYPNVNGVPYIMGVSCSSRKPGHASRRKPV